MTNKFNTAVYFLIACSASFSTAAHADASIDPATAQAIAKVFSEHQDPNKPALAVALLRDGKIVYEKAFGSANLEYKIPATVDTKFQADTLAWEFIAAAILILQEQGKLGLDDDIRQYLPDIPDFGKKISINHLLSSTDGLYGYSVMQSLAGWESKEPVRYDTILPLIREQTTLNFSPGESFSPGGDTRLILLMKIVELVSGQAFDAYCKSAMFVPLKMSNTSFFKENSALPNNLAAPYIADSAGSYTTGRPASPIVLYTSIHDLAIWRSNLSASAPGKKSLADRLNSPLKLDGGGSIRDISGISTYGQLHASMERGIPKVYRTGGSGGYASAIFHFPDQNVTAIALSSGLAYNGSYAMRIASTLLKSHFTEPETIDYSSIAGVRPGAAQLRQYEGNYWSPLRAIAARVHVKNDVLHYSRIDGQDGRASIPLSDTLFQLKIDGDDKYVIKFVERNKRKAMHFIMGDSDPVIFEPYTPVSYTHSALAQFAGTFYSKELDSSFEIETRQGILTAKNIRVGTVNLKPITADVFSGDKSFMGSIKFSRDMNKDVTGFQIRVDEVRHLEFKKIHIDGDSKLRRL